ncbi:response regulator [Zavarzinia sp. CC-PAN008]|uniref:response regulator n=1 Tax=Zavarzinia sp. CC-PAN008 TaxID=3243332 RepID=UPI003F7435E9
MTTILLVEDDATVRRGLSRALATAGYTVVEAEHGAAALEQLEVHKVDLVLTDIVMPGIDGLALVAELNSKRPGLPIVTMSGGGRTMPAPLALPLSEAYGATRTLYKPFRTSELLEVLAEVCAP